CRRRLCARRLYHRRARGHGFGCGGIDRRDFHRGGGGAVGVFPRGIARPDQHILVVYPPPAVSASPPVRRPGIEGVAPILGAMALLGLAPLVTSSNVVLNFLILVLLIALVGQGWNLLGGYGGQYSFGHAAFFGTGAYVTAILQTSYGINAWVGFCIGIVAG